MQPFTTLTAVAVPFDQANIDTNQLERLAEPGLRSRIDAALREPRAEGRETQLHGYADDLKAVYGGYYTLATIRSASRLTISPALLMGYS